MELWQSLLVAVGGNAALLAVIAYLGRSLIGQFLTKDVEEFKVKLKAESDIAIERLRAELHRTSMEHQVRFSRLHDERAVVLARLHKLLVAAVQKVQSFASFGELPGEPDKLQKYDTAMMAITNYFGYFDRHRIYLPADLCDALEALAHKLRVPTGKFGFYVRMKDPTGTAKAEMHRAWDAAWQSAEDDVPVLRAAIENEMRKLLGVLPGN
jgi:hypothetical protein